MIICCGEALIDMLPRRLSDRSSAYLPVPGGAVFNTAVALGRLGRKTGFFSGLSNDVFGAELASHLNASNVDTSLCVRSARPTTLAFVSLTNGNAQYTFYDENTAGRSLSVEDLPQLPSSTEALHFGAISLIAEPCGSAYEELMLRYHKSAVISLDPNIRPGFVENENTYRERLQRMTSMSDIIKVSEEDLSWLDPDRPFDDLAYDWLNDGASIVILTMGENGVRALTRNTDIVVPAVEAELVDTVGAGDSFNAGFLAGLHELGILSKSLLRSIDQTSLEKALSLATRVAAHTVSQAGANPPWRSEL